MKRVIKASTESGSKEQLIEILNHIKDKVLVTGSYASHTEGPASDIDFLIKLKDDDAWDKEVANNGWSDSGLDQSYCHELIQYFESLGYDWDSCFTQSFSVDDTYIPLEFSVYYDCDEEHVFTVNILGVRMNAVRSTVTNDKYLNGVKRSKLQ